jgi:hypothetical protein
MGQLWRTPSVLRPAMASRRGQSRAVGGERARHAAAPPSPAAPRGADDGLAGRTGLRDEGPDPLEPPGVTWAQQWPRLGASGERVMGAQPSAVLTKRLRLLAVLPLFPQAFAPLVIRCRWLHHLAQRLTADTRRAQAPSRLLTGVHPLHPRCSHDGRLRVVADVEQITIAVTPHLIEALKPPRWPRTKNDLALFMARLKTSRRHITGRQPPHALILRDGSVRAMLFGLPETTHGVETFPRGNPDALHHTLHRWRQPANRRTCWHARHDFAAYRASLEPHGVSHECVVPR